MKNLLFLSFLFISFSCFSQNQSIIAVDDTVLIYNAYPSWKGINIRSNDQYSLNTGVRIDTVYGATNGSATYNMFNFVIYRPDSLFSGTDEVTCVICDSQDSTLCDTSILYITVKQLQWTEYIDINNIKASVTADGGLFWDKQNPKFEFPKGSEKHTIFAGEMWLGGKVSSTDSLHVLAETYKVGGSIFYPGPITNGDYIFEDEEKWTRLWKVSRLELDYHRMYWHLPNYQIPEAILNWPAHGQIIKGEAYYLAPFVDRNNNGLYEPHYGDYPKVKGDQAVYFIYSSNYTYPGKEYDTNDTDQLHSKEIHGMLYGYNCSESTALNNTLFLDYSIYNRSQFDYKDFWVGIFLDLDIGDPSDDFMACDVNRSAFYCFNGDNADLDNNGAKGYGTSPPAQSCVFLSGLKQDADGIDNEFGIAEGQTINGTGYGDRIIDNERRGMDRFISLSRLGSSCCTPPVSGISSYRNLQSKWKDGITLTYGGSGYDTTSTDTCKFAFPSGSDPYHFGTWGATIPSNLEWNGANSGISTGDKMGVASMGPVSFEAGEVKNFTVAFIVADSDTGDEYSSVALMKQYIDEVREMYLNNTSPCGQTFFSTGITEKNSQKGFKVFPNPATNYLTVNMKNKSATTKFEIYNVFGKLIIKKQLNQSTVDISNLPSGVYFFRINGETQKFIKQ